VKYVLVSTIKDGELWIYGIKMIIMLPLPLGIRFSYVNLNLESHTHSNAEMVVDVGSVSRRQEYISTFFINK
jgi:hypothetical protein